MSRVTVGICAHNEERTIGQLLNQILSEKIYLKEIFVVASGCTDRTVDIVNRLRKKDKRIKLMLEDSRKGQTYAQNLIFKKAKGDIILLADGDGLIKKGSIENLIAPFSNPYIYATHGKPLPLVHRNFTGKMIKYFWHMHHEISLFSPKLTTELCAFRKGAIRKIPYRIILDDAYMSSLLNRKGLKTVYVPNSVKFMFDYYGKSKITRYFKWRKKDLAGRIQLKYALKKLGMKKPVGIAPYRPFWLTINLFVKETLKKLWKEPMSIFYISSMLAIEVAAAIAAYLELLQGNIPYIWER